MQTRGRGSKIPKILQRSLKYGPQEGEPGIGFGGVWDEERGREGKMG